MAARCVRLMHGACYGTCNAVRMVGQAVRFHVDDIPYGALDVTAEEVPAAEPVVADAIPVHDGEHDRLLVVRRHLIQHEHDVLVEALVEGECGVRDDVPRGARQAAPDVEMRVDLPPRRLAAEGAERVQHQSEVGADALEGGVPVVEQRARLAQQQQAGARRAARVCTLQAVDVPREGVHERHRAYKLLHGLAVCAVQAVQEHEHAERPARLAIIPRPAHRALEEGDEAVRVEQPEV
eukprot:766115-Hanusia_phi.AAC.1